VPRHHDVEERLDLRLPVQPASVPIGRRAAAKFALLSGSSDRTLWRVRLAVSEALSNVVLHAHALEVEPAAELTLTGHTTSDRFVITVSDAGQGLRARSDSPGLGLGLALIAQTCDEVQLDPGEAGGTVVRMTFLR